MLQVRGLSVRYGRSTALHDVSLEVPERGFAAVLGRNGAGKTTLVHAVAGVLRPAAGEVWFRGQRIDGCSPGVVVRRGITVVPEGRQLFSRLSVLDNLRLGAFGTVARGGRGWLRSLGPARAETDGQVERVFELLPELRRLAARTAGQLSGGEQQMVAVGRALMAWPALLLVDELSLGLAPQVVARLAEHLRALRERGVGVVLIEQNVGLALELADSAYILESGRLRFGGPAEEVLSRRNVLASYLDTRVA
jgi:branched-chain amino acid transport system ATP-binding protein